ncbi:hypothetical protein ACFUIY_21170 [Streptomyces griseorubiginosus]|uniref:hypothetical protein n=1 Tax=Streptomyces griseorubiginosus TaxID=67304 RepID=UPI003637568B
MAVTLDPKVNLRRGLAKLFRNSDFTLEGLADRMGLTPDIVESYLNLEVVPDAALFLKLRNTLTQGQADKDHWMYVYYVQALARQQPKRRTSRIRNRYVSRADEPDPMKAESAADLVDKLREVHRWAMKPSLRELEARTGGELKRSTLSDMLKPGNKTLPRFDRYVIFLDACGVLDVSYWTAAYRKLTSRPSTPSDEILELLQFDRYKQRKAARVNALP